MMKKNFIVHFWNLFFMHSFSTSKHIFFVNLIKILNMHGLGNLSIIWNENFFFMWIICCSKVKWVLEIWGVTFLSGTTQG
jgi:hypothetical protein